MTMGNMLTGINAVGGGIITGVAGVIMMMVWRSLSDPGGRLSHPCRGAFSVFLGVGINTASILAGTAGLVGGIIDSFARGGYLFLDVKKDIKKGQLPVLALLLGESKNRHFFEL